MYTARTASRCCLTSLSFRDPAPKDDCSGSAMRDGLSDSASAGNSIEPSFTRIASMAGGCD